jgi:hypothetical protein
MSRQYAQLPIVYAIVVPEWIVKVAIAFYWGLECTMHYRVRSIGVFVG